MRLAPRHSLIAVLAAVVLAAGCGGDDDDNGGSADKGGGSTVAQGTTPDESGSGRGSNDDSAGGSDESEDDSGGGSDGAGDESSSGGESNSGDGSDSGSSGSGGELSKSEYERQFNAALKRVTEDVRKNADPSDQFGQVEGSAKAVQDLAGDLSELSPPAEIASAHRNLVSGYEAIGKAYQKVADAVRRRDRDAIRQLGSNLVQPGVARKVQRAANKLRKKGYKIRGIGIG